MLDRDHRIDSRYDELNVGRSQAIYQVGEAISNRLTLCNSDILPTSSYTSY